MDYSAGSSLFPLHRCKTIHLVGNIHSPSSTQRTRDFSFVSIIDSFIPLLQVRHAQGIHNVEGDKNYKAYMNPDYFDAHLTPLGWQQVSKKLFFYQFLHLFLFALF